MALEGSASWGRASKARPEKKKREGERGNRTCVNDARKQ